MRRGRASVQDRNHRGFLVLGTGKRDNHGMEHIVTLSERKSTEAARRQAAVAALVPVLAEYARAHGGRFLMYGSAARGTMTYHSDVDVLLDFPEDAAGDAWNFAESACWSRGLEPDLVLYGGCKKAFLDHIAPDLLVAA